MDIQRERPKANHHAEKGDLYIQAILQTVMDGFWIVNLEGMFIDVNEIACNMVGYSRIEMLKLSLSDLEVSESHEQTLKHLQKVFEIGEDRFASKHRCKNGKIIDVEVSVKFQSAQNFIVAFIRDITERVQSENSIADLVNRLTLSMEVSKAGSWDWDIQNNTFFWSKEFLNLFGMGPGTVPGFESWTKSLHPDDIEAASKRIKEAIDNKTDLLQDYRIVLPDGTHRWIRASGKVTYQNDIPIRMIGLCFDLTERKLAEEVLRDSEKKFRSLFETMSEGVVYEDHDGNIISANPAAERLLGLSLDQMQGRTSLDPRWRAIHEDGSPFPGENHSLNVAAKTGKPSTGEIMGIYNPKSDSHIWLSINATPEFLPGEKMPFRAYAVFRDITERKKSEETIKLSEERYRLLFQNLKAGFALHEIILNTEGKSYDYRFLEINQAFEEITGLKAIDSIGKTVMEVLPNTEPSWIKTYGEVALKGKSINFENYNQDLNKHFQVSAYSPEPGRFATIFLDITERKLAEEKIREKDIQFRKLSSNLPDLIFQFTRRPDGTYCVPIASEGIRNIFGCSPEDVVDDFTPIGRVIYPDDAARVINDIEYSAEHLTYFTCEFRVQIPGKAIQWIYSRSSPEKLDDGSITWYGFNADITDRKSAEEALENSRVGLQKALEDSNRARQSLLSVLEDQRLVEREIQKLNAELEQRVLQRTAQLEAANKELETFTYSVSHDLKAPLRGIDGYSKLLLDIHSKNLDEEAKTFISTIRSSTMQMNQLIEDLLEYSRLERSNLKNEKVKLNDLIDSTTSLFKNDLKNGKFVLNLDIPDVELITDEKGLSIILRNILENAIKFTKEKSEPTIEIGLEEQPTAWIIRIKDNGIGFDMKYHQRIFEIFQRLHRAEDYVGTGIGLAMVNKAIQRLNGKVWAESTPGKGSTFYLELPKLQQIENK